MKAKTSRALSLFLALLLIIPLLPAAFIGVSARSVITDPVKASGGDYTSDTGLIDKLNSIFSGTVGLYSDAACTQAASAPLGSAVMTGSNRYYVKSNTTGSVIYGWQCYIYANGVYNTLFNEWVGHAASFSHSLIVIGGGLTTVSFALFKTAGVRTGAYLRTTTDATGAYNGSGGHSMIVLSYDELSVTVLEGNADGAGLVRITVNTWNEFNTNYLTSKGRVLCHVVQPTPQYYDYLYGDANAFSNTFPVDYNLDGGVMTPNTIKTFTASGENRSRGTDQLIMYTDIYGASTRTNQYGTEIVIDSTGLATAAPGYGIGNNAIPLSGFVLSGHDEGGKPLADIYPGMYIAYVAGTLDFTVYADRESYLIGAKKVTVNNAYGDLPTPIKEGYYFTGWIDAAGRPVTPDTVFTDTAAVTLTACWTPVPAMPSLIYRNSLTGTIDDENGLLYNIPAETTAAALMSAVCLSDTQFLEVRDQTGAALLPDAPLSTGCMLCLIADGITADTVLLSVRGDVDGNGFVDVSDARIVLRVSAGFISFGKNKATEIAADVLGDGELIDNARKILRVAAQLDTF